LSGLHWASRQDGLKRASARGRISAGEYHRDEQGPANHPRLLGDEDLRDHSRRNRQGPFVDDLECGYAVSSLILIGIFIATLLAQLASKSYYPFLYWTVILSTSTAGTTMSDYVDRRLELGYPTGAAILLTILLAVLALWRFTVRSLSVSNIRTFKVEAFYWTAILFSNTLGTALGDFLADSSGLGFAGGALLIEAS